VSGLVACKHTVWVDSLLPVFLLLLQVEYNFNDAWAGLLNKCLESRQPQFTYK
jgi:hypothetical protein